MKTRNTLTIMAILMATLFTSAQTIIPAGAVEGIWTLSESPYQIEGEIYVEDNTTLTIEPGVEVQFNTIKVFRINGRLLAEGTKQDSILFTNYNSEVRWGGITWDGTPSSNDSSKIAYCIFEYAYGYPDGAIGNSSGAIGVRNFDNLSILNSAFRHNLVDQGGFYAPSGGAIGLWNSSIFISHCIFYDNKAKYGGAILYYLNSDGISDNCLFYDNTATSRGGAVEVWSNSNPYFINCTFVDNYSSISGGAIDVYESMPHLINCIIWGNNSNIGNNQVNIQTASAGLNTYYCDIEKGEGGFSGYTNQGNTVNMLDANPNFMGNGDFPYAIDETSPCLNYGSLEDEYLPAGWECPCLDLADATRICYECIDLGAYEYTDFGVGLSTIDVLNLSILPNPTSNTFQLNYQLQKKQFLSIDLYSITGQVIKSIKSEMTPVGAHQHQVDLSSLPNGYYLLRLQIGNEVVTRKVVKI
ncbi:MAG: T9SS type A sorting domain-containing protein [Chlamydiia bacterium]|nr:T9SS type A sorting domain-containing protein [Chlamydiia bacterium]